MAKGVPCSTAAVQHNQIRPLNKNIENNPMHSSQVVAGMDGFGDGAKAFDTSGKSLAIVHHHALVWLNQVRLFQLIYLDRHPACRCIALPRVAMTVVSAAAQRTSIHVSVSTRSPDAIFIDKTNHLFVQA